MVIRHSEFSNGAADKSVIKCCVEKDTQSPESGMLNSPQQVPRRVVNGTAESKKDHQNKNSQVEATKILQKMYA